jgi:hypothetical protein
MRIAMTNFCGDSEQELQRLRQERERLAGLLAESERARRAGRVFTTADMGTDIVLPSGGGRFRTINTADADRGIQQITEGIEDEKLDAYILTSFGKLEKPNIAEGRWQNYDRILQEVSIYEQQDYAKLAELLGTAIREIAPEDYAFVTTKYGRAEMAGVIADAMADLGVTAPEVAARIASDAAGFVGLVEKMTRVRLFADRSKYLFLDEIEQISNFMERYPNIDVPGPMKETAYEAYKLALVGERHFAFARRRTAQTLRSLQDPIESGRTFTLQVGQDAADSAKAADDFLDTPEAGEALTLKPRDVDIDSFIGQVISRVDEGPAGLPALRQMVDSARLEGGLDPMAKLEEGWFNTTMRRARAMARDSQLSGLRTQLISGEVSNLVMAFAGPLQKTMADGMVMVPAGTDSLKRLGLVEASKINAKAWLYAWHGTRHNLKAMLTDAYKEGVTRFGGNPDAYGTTMSSNAETRAEVMATHMQPWAKRNFLANVAMAGPKLNAAARLQLQKLHQDIPLYPALRMLGSFDEMHGKFNYLFHLMSELQVESRAKAGTLGLDTEAKRQAWVQKEIDRALYSVNPTEEDLIAFRRQARLGQADSSSEQIQIEGIARRADGRLSDQEVIEMMMEARIADTPTFATEHSLRAFEYANEMRFQNKMKPEMLTSLGGGERGWIGAVDDAVVDARRQNWFVDTMLPYWRAPMNAMLFDFRLATSPLYDPFKMATLTLQGKAGTEEMRKVAARWVMSMGLLGGFAMLRESGQITGGSHPDPAKRNRIFGIPYLGGIPILSTLFLWSDVSDALAGRGATDAEGNEAMNGVLQVLTGQIMRGTGIQQLQQLTSAIMDRDIDATRSLVAFGGFLARGHFVPFSGAAGTMERLTGMDQASQFMGGQDSTSVRFNQGVAGVEVDGPFEGVLKRLREVAYATVPGTAGLAGNRKEYDWLGSPRGHIAGIDMARAIPLGFPGTWPNDPIYAELEALEQLDPPAWVRRGNLDGVGMSGRLQKEAVEILGSIKGESLLASFAMAGRTVKLRLRLPATAVLANGVRVGSNGAAEVDLAPFLEPHVKGRKIADAYRSLFNSPVYRAMEASSELSSDPTINRGIPSAERRRQPAQLMVRAIKDYYTDLVRGELERRAQQGDQEAMEWSMAKTKAVEGAMQRGQEGIRSLPELFRTQ